MGDDDTLNALNMASLKTTEIRTPENTSPKPTLGQMTPILGMRSADGDSLCVDNE